MNSLQYQEHIDHEMGAASDLQNAFAMSQMNRQADDIIPEDGRFHVIYRAEEYCQSTDAYLGVVNLLRDSFDTREEAEKVCDELVEECCGEMEFWVSPEAVREDKEVEEAISESDMPF